MAVSELFMHRKMHGTPIYHDDKVWFDYVSGDMRFCIISNTESMHLTLAGVSALSTFYYGADGYFYFRGDIASEGLTSKLIKMNADGGRHYYAALSPTNCISSALAPGDGHVYFLTDGNKLMYVDPSAPPAAAEDYESVECATTPVVPPMGPAESMFYSEPDGMIRRIGLARNGKTPGAAIQVCDKKTTEPLLACADGYLYFTVDKTLYRFALTDSESTTPTNTLVLNHKVVGGLKAFDSGFDKRIYYLADDGFLYSVTVDPWQATAPTTALCNTKMGSVPVPGPPGLLFCRGADDMLYKIPTT